MPDHIPVQREIRYRDQRLRDIHEGNSHGVYWVARRSHCWSRIEHEKDLSTGKYKKDLVAFLVYTEVAVVDIPAGLCPKSLRTERTILPQTTDVGFVCALVLELAERGNVLGP